MHNVTSTTDRSQPGTAFLRKVLFSLRKYKKILYWKTGRNTENGQALIVPLDLK